MKKTFARFLTVALTLAMLVCCFAGLTVSAAESEEEYTLFIAYGGDKEAENDWGWQYYGSDVEGITSTTATVKSGDTATISLTFATANVNSWFFAPCLVGTGAGTDISAIDFTITCKIDGVEVPVNMAADAEGKTWWAEGTGDYTAADCIRLAGGYNEWATKFIDEPAGFTTIEYTITLNSIEVGGGQAAGATVESTEEYGLFIAYGGDKAAENDWGWQYYGSDAEGVTAVTATAKSGDTVTISLTFDTPTVNSWFFAPCLTGTGAGDQIAAIDFTIVCKIDGVEVPVNMEADAEGKTWWAEGTGDYTGADCIRLAGGYNEWATQYIEEPAGFTTIEYTITLNSIQIGTAVEEEPVEIPIDLDGTYNAYLLLQTPNWTFRDAHNSANGIGSDVWGQHITNNDSGVNYGVVTDAVVAGNGTYTISITDFGTVFADDFTAAGQEYFNIIGVSTDIPKSDKIQVTDVKLIIDGQVRHTYDTAVLNPDTTDTIQILIQNIWNSDVKEISYYPAPSTSLEIQFTVSGFNYDNADQAVVEETEPVAEETEPVVEETEPVAEEEGGSNTALIVVAVVAVVAVAAVVVLKKKKAQ